MNLQFDRIQIHKKTTERFQKLPINRMNENCLSVQVLPSSKIVLTYIF